jgi:hypothetical protein
VGRSRLALAVAAAVAFIVTCTVRGGLLDDRPSGDLLSYERFAERMLDGEVPYRDFFVEYPPGALPAFVVPEAVADDYRLAFGLEMLLCGLAAVALVALVLSRIGASPRRYAAALAFLAAAPAALGPVLLQRYDLWPTLLAAAAVAALVLRRRDAGFALLGLGTAVKAFPAVLLPAALLRGAPPRRALAISGSVLVAVATPFLLLGFTGLGNSTWVQLRRGLQVESLGASILLTLGQAAGYEPTVVNGKPGSRDLAGLAAEVVGTTSTVLQLLAIAAVILLARRIQLDDEAFLLACAASLVGLVTFGKVLSPQFLVWLLPFVPLVAGPTGVAACALLGAASLLTQVWFVEAVTPFDLDGEAWIVLARNLLLVALYLVLVARLRRLSAAPARRPPRPTSAPPARGRPPAA